MHYLPGSKLETVQRGGQVWLPASPAHPLLLQPQNLLPAQHVTCRGEWHRPQLWQWCHQQQGRDDGPCC